jgi:hypothetical protein
MQYDELSAAIQAEYQTFMSSSGITNQCINCGKSTKNKLFCCRECQKSFTEYDKLLTKFHKENHI